MNNPLKIAVAGLGTVGGATLQLIQAQADILSQRCGRDLVVTHVSARDRNRDRGLDLAGIAWVDDPMALATTDNIDVVVELIGGSEGIARDLVEASLKAGRHVVTANKALMAHHGNALGQLAEGVRAARD